MSSMEYHGNLLYIEDVSLADIADRFGTPCYVYSRKQLEENWRRFDNAFQELPHRVCFAVKANSNIAILNILAKLNSGFDIVSIGELERVLAAGGDPKKIVFSGVGKQAFEIERAIKVGIHCFNVESQPELERIHTIASRLNTKINIALRINPNIDPQTHAHISTGMSHNKFGIDLVEVIPLCQKITNMPFVNLIGIASHIGSQITDLSPFLDNVDCLLNIYNHLQKMDIQIKQINIGGGLGITYRHEQPPAIAAYAKALQEKIANYPVEIILEPGRVIVGNVGVLLTRIEYIKETSNKRFAIVDAGMNDLIRPALYNAWQNIMPVEIRPITKARYDIAGPVCESSDFLGKDRDLAIQPNDLLVVSSAGAYGFSMSSNYNSRRRPAEVLVAGDHMHLIRRREALDELFADEMLLPEQA